MFLLLIEQPPPLLLLSPPLSAAAAAETSGDSGGECVSAVPVQLHLWASLGILQSFSFFPLSPLDQEPLLLQDPVLCCVKVTLLAHDS